MLWQTCMCEGGQEAAARLAEQAASNSCLSKVGLKHLLTTMTWIKQAILAPQCDRGRA